MRSALVAFMAFVLFSVGVTAANAAAQAEKRIAFVVGNSNYAAGVLPTAANDAGLIAQTLQAAGFEVVGARDLDAETFRQSYADFLKRVTAAGPDTVAFVYVSGYGLQYGNDNYYVPIGADVSRDLDIPIAAIRLSDLTGPLGGLTLKARFMVFDAAYKAPFKIEGSPLAGGFALVDAGPGSLYAYNAAPGTIAPVEKGNYGLYAQSLAAMLREGGLPPDEIFDRVRLRVNEQSKGAEVPWDSSKIDAKFRFFDRGKDAPPPVATAEQTAALVDKPIRDLPVKEAYTAAVARDTVQSYSDFTAVYGSDPLAKRARVLLAARREAVTWRRTVAADTPDAYWSYLSRYPKGPHAFDARLRLQALSAELAPPPSYQMLDYDVPPPPPEEVVYVDRPVIYFDDPGYDFPPPPPPPDYWLPPVPVAFLDLPPPPEPDGLFFLPVPAFVPLPAYYDPPPYVAYPTDNYFYGGGGGFDRGRGDVFINNTTIVNNIHQGFPAGGPRGLAGAGAAGDPGGGGNHLLRNAAIGAAAVALPAAVAAHAVALQRRGITTPAQLNAARREPGGLGGLRPNGTQPGAPGGARNALPAAQQLPGANGTRLPPQTGARGGATPGVVPGAKGTPGANQAGRPGTLGTAGRPGAPGAGGAGANVRDNALARPGGPAGAGAAGRLNPANRGAGAAGAAQDKAAARRDALQQRQNAAREQRLQTQQRVQQQRVQRQELRQQQPRVAPQARQAAPQQFRQAPQQFRQQAPQQQFRPQAAPQARPGGFGGGGGGRPPSFGGGGGGGRPPSFGGGGGGGGRPPSFGGGGGGGGRPAGGGGGGGGGHPAPGIKLPGH